MSPVDQWHHQARDGAGAPGGPPKAEPGAGSAGRGAAQRRRLDDGEDIANTRIDAALRDT